MKIAGSRYEFLMTFSEVLALCHLFVVESILSRIFKQFCLGSK